MWAKGGHFYSNYHNLGVYLSLIFHTSDFILTFLSLKKIFFLVLRTLETEYRVLTQWVRQIFLEAWWPDLNPQQPRWKQTQLWIPVTLALGDRQADSEKEGFWKTERPCSKDKKQKVAEVTEYPPLTPVCILTGVYKHTLTYIQHTYKHTNKCQILFWYHT